MIAFRFVQLAKKASSLFYTLFVFAAVGIILLGSASAVKAQQSVYTVGMEAGILTNEADPSHFTCQHSGGYWTDFEDPNPPVKREGQVKIRVYVDNAVVDGLDAYVSKDPSSPTYLPYVFNGTLTSGTHTVRFSVKGWDNSADIVTFYDSTVTIIVP